MSFSLLEVFVQFHNSFVSARIRLTVKLSFAQCRNRQDNTSMLSDRVSREHVKRGPHCGVRQLHSSAPAILMVWIFFLARGAFYSVAVPMWEGFDEYAHFAYVQHVASGSLIAAPTDRATREIERSIELVPMPWVLRAEPPPHETQESYGG